jgi:hypothetical protein
MVPVDDVARDPRFGKVAEAVAEGRLYAYDAAPRLGGCGTQESEDLGRRLGAQPADRAVEMEVTGVQEAKGSRDDTARQA